MLVLLLLRERQVRDSSADVANKSGRSPAFMLVYDRDELSSFVFDSSDLSHGGKCLDHSPADTL